jgi:hypothetical protein
MGKRIESPYFAVQLGKPRPPAPSRAKPKKPLPKRRKGAARLKTAGKVVAGHKLRPLVEDRAYLDSLRDEPCFFTGLPGTPDDPVEAMHIGNPGKNCKSDDETLPARHSLVHHLTHLQGLIKDSAADLPAGPDAARLPAARRRPRALPILQSSNR